MRGAPEKLVLAVMLRTGYGLRRPVPQASPAPHVTRTVLLLLHLSRRQRSGTRRSCLMMQQRQARDQSHRGSRGATAPECLLPTVLAL